jgi:hypothetical protein
MGLLEAHAGHQHLCHCQAIGRAQKENWLRSNIAECFAGKGDQPACSFGRKKLPAIVIKL